MSNSIYLVGAEDVQRAASSMRQAATEMQSAASTIAYAVEEQKRFLGNWLAEFGAMLEAHRPIMKDSDHA